MMSVSFTSELTFDPGTPEVLFDLSDYLYDIYRNYDVAPDGRFLMVKPVRAIEQKIVVVENWLEEVKRLIPTD